ncbi:MAG: hypothetical protein K6U08_06395 [Firmicutes bacterium]|nr:hypothetical protein [Bacillota bacterium]
MITYLSPLRTAVVETIGLFDARFDACEDVHFNRRLRRAGHWCYFAPQLRLIYRCRRSFGGLFQQMVRYGRGRARLLLRSPGGVSGPAAVALLALLAVAGALWQAASSLPDAVRAPVLFR